jgi:glycosyltransferase involved in cell wall biosynthesis
MKVLIVHSPYAQRGGEEQVVATQTQVLRARGHDVVAYEGRDAGPLVTAERPDIVHVHQQFPALRPSVYAAARAARVPVVQHLHNARLACIEPFLVRDGVACDDCVGRSMWPGIAHRCYRGSAVQSAAAAGIQLAHRRMWKRDVTRFVAVSESVAATLRGTLPGERIAVCHNGLDADPGARDPSDDAGDALYVGRLSPEKGVDLLIDAAAQLPEMQFRVVGDGPERGALAARAGTNVAFTGRLDRSGVLAALARARVLVAPSRGQEPFGLGVIEAAAVGVPAIVTRVGGLPEIVRDGVTGRVVAPFDADAIVGALRDLDALAMGAAARRDYEARFTPDAFADRLLAIYDDVLATYAP